MIKQVFENRHPDGGIPELVTYATCDDCGVDITHDHCYFLGEARDGRECYCEECAVNNGWVKCDCCGEIVEERHTAVWMTEEKRETVVCHSCLEKLEEEA